jgi:spoIIIJ-associated protein
MESLEICGKTVEEATKKALAQLNASLDEVEISVIAEGKSGILGLGAEEAKIIVKLLSTESNRGKDDIDAAKSILEGLLTRMGFRATINVEKPEMAFNEDGEANPIVFNIVGDDLGILIGRRGQTIDSLQYLVRLISSKQTKTKTPIIVDVEHYKQRRYDDIRTLALNVAAQVKAKKTSFRLEPMPPFERRIIHLTLADDPEVTTESMGEGDARKVVVLPKSKKF